MNTPEHLHRRYDAHYNDAGRVVWTVTQEPVKFTPELPETPTLLNRAQRRHLQRYIKRKTRAQMREVKRRKPWIMDAAKQRCGRCGLYFLGSAGQRCQCQVQQRHHCLMCGAGFVASQQEYRLTNVCAECAVQIQAQWDNEEALRAAVYEEVSDEEVAALLTDFFEENDDLYRALADL